MPPSSGEFAFFAPTGRSTMPEQLLSNSGSSDHFSTVPSYPYAKGGIAPYQTRFNSIEEKDPFLNLPPSFLPYYTAPSVSYPSMPYSSSPPPRPLRSSRPLAPGGALQPQSPLQPQLQPPSQSPSQSQSQSQPSLKKAAPKPLNDVVDIAKVDAGEDTRTYIMLRNLPNRYRLDQVSAVLERAVGNKFTIVSMPVDPQTSRNLGYCFVQFTSTTDVAKAYRAVRARLGTEA